MAKATESREIQDVKSEANKSVIDDEMLRNINSAEDVMALFDSLGAEVESFDDYGTGFTIVQNKDLLIDRPFAILEWRFTKSPKFNSEFVSMFVVTKSGEKYIVNDGSTGICAQLRRIADERIRNGRANPQIGLRVDRGLRKSTYQQEYTDEKTGKIETREATTYYLA